MSIFEYEDVRELTPYQRLERASNRYVMYAQMAEYSGLPVEVCREYCEQKLRDQGIYVERR